MSTTILSTRLDGARGVVWLEGDPAEVIERLLDEAHAALDPAALAELLVAVRKAIVPLRSGAAPAVPAAVPRFPDGAAAPIRRYLTPVRVAAALGAIGPASGEGRLPAVHARIDAYLEEVAARPRGAAIVREPT